jgi:hypothetical protein
MNTKHKAEIIQNLILDDEVLYGEVMNKVVQNYDAEDTEYISFTREKNGILYIFKPISFLGFIEEKENIIFYDKKQVVDNHKVKKRVNSSQSFVLEAGKVK